jgi:hypothetical protein
MPFSPNKLKMEMNYFIGTYIIKKSYITMF